MRWPTSHELRRLQEEENDRAERDNREPDPICECGEIGACRCEEMAEDIGYWVDGTPYDYPEYEIDYEPYIEDWYSTDDDNWVDEDRPY